MEELKMLEMTTAKISKTCFHNLEKFPRLQSLSFTTDELDACSGEALYKCLNLRKLRLAHIREIKEDALEWICKCSELSKLIINNCNLTPAMLSTIAKLPKLQKLDLDHLTLNENTLKALEKVPFKKRVENGLRVSWHHPLV